MMVYFFFGHSAALVGSETTMSIKTISFPNSRPCSVSLYQLMYCISPPGKKLFPNFLTSKIPETEMAGSWPVYDKKHFFSVFHNDILSVLCW